MGVTAVIVQARLGSTRLPGKVLKPLNGSTVLEHVLARCAAIAEADVVVCATVAGESEDAIGPVAEAAGAVVSVGPEHDVLERYCMAAKAVEATEVVRITSDCPLTDPAVASDVISARRAAGADYAANNLVVTFPHGLDVEAMSAQALFEARVEAVDPGDREHVTPFLRRSARISRVGVEAPDAQWAHLRWTLDHPEDYEALSAIFEGLDLQPGEFPPWQDVAGYVDDHPDIAWINARHAVDR